MSATNPHTRALVKLIEETAHRHGTYDVFRDFVESAACALSCAMDLLHRDEREARYRQVMQKYTEVERAAFPEMLGELVQALEVEPSDVLGHVFGALDLGNKWIGQFFTPDAICRLTAEMTVGDGADQRNLIEQRGYVTLFEPAVGGGAMVIGYAEALRAGGINYQQHLHVTAVDVDARAVHMAYVQLSLLGIPAVVVLGNTLTLEEREHWYTPAHVLGMWDNKLQRGYALGSAMDTDSPAPAPESIPLPAVVTQKQMEMFSLEGAA